MSVGYRFSCITIFVALLFMLGACAQHTKDALNSNLPSTNPVLSTAKMTMSESLGKTIIEFPIDSNTQIYADYDAQNNINVVFTPFVNDFVLTNQLSDLVNGFEKKVDKDKVATLKVKLNEKCKFLLSKQSDILGRLMLVADSASAESVKSPSAAPLNSISSLNFKHKDGSLQIITYSSYSYDVSPSQDASFKLVLNKTTLLPALVKQYDLSNLNAGVSTVRAINDGKGNAVLAFNDLNNPSMSISRKGDETLISVRTSSANFSEKPTVSKAIAKNAEEYSETDSKLQELNTLFPGMKENYTGEKISIDLQDADIEHVLRLISEISGHNLILDDEITGKISLKLVDIPWDQALDLVLLQKNLGMVIKGNIMRIASASKLEAERAQLQKAREAAVQAQISMQNLAPLKTDYVQINYNTAADFEGKVKTFLSEKGSVTSDSRTNMLIIKDNDERLKNIKNFIKKLDRPERQVMVEARLVYATDEFQRSLGVKWGTAYQPETASNMASEQWRGSASSTGLNMLNTVSGVTLGGTIGKYLGEDLFTLDASLQLGEAKNLVKTISSPRVLTLNNNRAEIQQGTKLATATESESGGTTTEYEEAVLKISVLPQITPDNKLILDLEISDDSPKSDGRDIDTKKTKTKMMVNDRETIVIGGVQKTTDTTGISQVPGVGDVPGLGWLFKNKYKAKNKAELLIFIQTRIL